MLSAGRITKTFLVMSLIALGYLFAKPGQVEAAAKVDLEQCANGTLSAPLAGGTCDYERGNMNEQKSHYAEGNYISYRMVITGLASGPHVLQFSWDTTKQSKHAIDWIGTHNITNTGANPCQKDTHTSNQTEYCTLASFSDEAFIPVDPNIQSATITPLLGPHPTMPTSGKFYAWGADITNETAAGILNITYSLIPAGSYVGDTSTTLVQINFTVPNPAGTVVFAWAGHIGDHRTYLLPDSGWGTGNSAVDVSGSPYHTSLVSLDGSGGNLDLQLAASAITSPARITVNKLCVPNTDNGNPTFPFTYTAPGQNAAAFPNSPLACEDSENLDINSFANANGDNYIIAETPATGWRLTALQCDLMDTLGNVITQNIGQNKNLSTGSITLSVHEGDTINCTYTNKRKPRLIVTKLVTTDDGGNAEPSQFDISVSGDSPSPSGFPGDPDGTLVILDPSGDNDGDYDVNEAAFSGYVGTFSGDCNSNGVGTVPDGGTHTCTITNDDQPATLTLVKTVENDNGGSATEDDFQAYINENEVPWGAAQTLNAGSYTASEDGMTGYVASSWGGDCEEDGTITLNAGDNKTCSITNDDIAPILHLRKIVTNDNGGEATLADFTLTANGTDSNDLSGTSPVDSGAGLKADTFELSETEVAGYDASDWVCVGGDQSGASVTLALGESATCTINNDDQTAHLTLIKTVTTDNGGTAVAADWTLSANGPTPIFGPGGVSSDVNTGTYSLSESPGPAGYTAGNWNCVGGTQNGASVTLALGQSATCTINNDDIAAMLRLLKQVVNTVDGPANDAGRFDLFINDVLKADNVGHGAIPGGIVSSNVQPGIYSVHEEAGTMEDDNETPLHLYVSGIACFNTADFFQNGPGATPIAMAGPFNLFTTNGVPAENPTLNNLTLNLGDDVICIFQNTAKGQMPVNKLINGKPAPFDENDTPDIWPNYTYPKYRFTLYPDPEGTPNPFYDPQNDDPSSKLDDATLYFADFFPEHSLFGFYRDLPPEAAVEAIGGPFAVCEVGINLAPNDPDANEGMPAGYTSVWRQRHNGQPTDPYVLSDTFNGDVQDGVDPEDARNVTCIQDVTLEEGGSFELQIDNITTGQIQIIKETQGGDGTFTFNLNGPNPDPTDVVVTDPTSEGVGYDAIVALPTTLTIDTSAIHDSDPVTVLAGAGFSVSEGDLPEGWIAVGDPSCVIDGTATTVVPANFEVPIGGLVVCTFTNRKQPTLEVTKVLSPSDDEGTFALRIGNATYATGGDGTTTGAITLSVGPISFGETAVSPASMNNYDSIIQCNQTGFADVIGTDANITLAAGENVVCTITNTRKEIPIPGRFTGGGSFYPNTEIDHSPIAPSNDVFSTVRITHGFTLYCNTELGPNRLEINWASDGHGRNSENNFHLTSLTQVLCIDDLDIREGNPVADIDTYEGRGVGSLNQEDGYTAHWVFTDAGEPGKRDEVWIVIKEPNTTVVETPDDLNGEEVLRVGGNWDSPVQLRAMVPGDGFRTGRDGANIQNGNQQAHKFTFAVGAEANPLEADLAAQFLPISIGSLTVDSYDKLISILNKTPVSPATAKSAASDAAYNLAAQLTAAIINQQVGAGTCSSLATAIDGSQSLLDSIGFNGIGSYLTPALAKTEPNKTLRKEAQSFAGLLDAYNSGGCMAID